MVSLLLVTAAGFWFLFGGLRGSVQEEAHYQGQSVTGEWLTLRLFSPKGLRVEDSTPSVSGSLITRTNVLSIAGVIHSNRITGHLWLQKDGQSSRTIGTLEGAIRGSTVACSWREGFGLENPVGDAVLHLIGAEKHYSKKRAVGLGRYGASYEARVSFPVLDPTFVGSGKVNEAIDQTAVSDIRTFFDGFWGNVWEFLRLPSATFPWTSYTEFEVKLVTTNFLSACSVNHWYTGGAHGNYFYTSFNYFGETAESTEPFDLRAIMGEDGIRRCSDICLERLREQGASSVLDGFIEELSLEELSVFTVNPWGLVFHFSPYAVGSYVQGAFHVMVPAIEVSDMVSHSTVGKALQAYWQAQSRLYLPAGSREDDL